MAYPRCEHCGSNHASWIDCLERQYPKGRSAWGQNEARSPYELDAVEGCPACEKRAYKSVPDELHGGVVEEISIRDNIIVESGQDPVGIRITQTGSGATGSRGVRNPWDTADPVRGGVQERETGMYLNNFMIGALEGEGRHVMLKDKVQILILLMLAAALYIVVVPTALMRYPLALQTLVVWITFGLLADRLIGKKK